MSAPYSVCMIGNSHVAAPKMAWTKIRQDSQNDFALDFFAIQKQYFEYIELQNRALVTKRDDIAEEIRFRSDGLDRVHIDRYDAIVLVGSGFGIDLLTLRGRCGPPAQLEFARLRKLVSQDCFDAVLEATFATSPATILIDLVRQISQIPILLVPIPFVSERVLEDEETKKDFHMKDCASLGPYVARARAVGERVAAARGCEVIWQNDSTVAMPGFTRYEFHRGAIHFRTPEGTIAELDDRHGNEEYGRLVMTQVLARLDAISGGRVLAAADYSAASIDGVRSI